jgi:glycosyltransferase involved in cell wall biosynthesis
MKSKITVVYRLKNEEKWIGKSLESVLSFCDNVIVLDNNSIDNTVKICKDFSHVNIIEQPDLPFDESRDRNILLQKSLELKPDYVLSMDGDEILIPNSKEILEEELEILYPNSNVFMFQFLYMWDKLNQYRYDGVYENIWQQRLFKTSNQPENLKIYDTNYSGNAHASSIPNNTLGQKFPIRSTIKILHYGYFDQTLRNNKFNFYNKLTPNNKEQDMYSHIISGDGKHSGPHGMEFKLLPESLCYENL